MWPCGGARTGQAVAECVKLVKGEDVDYLALSVEERIDLLGAIISEPPPGDKLPVRPATHLSTARLLVPSERVRKSHFW